jgi:hypothetical protein
MTNASFARMELLVMITNHMPQTGTSRHVRSSLMLPANLSLGVEIVVSLNLMMNILAATLRL